MSGAQRATAAVRLRLDGANLEEIAEVLGYANGAAAQSAIVDKIASTGVELDDIKTLRALQVGRLEKLLKSAMPKAVDAKYDDGTKALGAGESQTEYMRIVISLVDNISTLTGAKAPQRVEVSTPKDQELADWVRSMARAHLGQEAAIEADPMELEQIEAIVKEDDNVEDSDIVEGELELSLIHI